MLSENQFRIIEYLYHNAGSEISLKEIVKAGLAKNSKEINFLASRDFGALITVRGMNDLEYKYSITAAGIKEYQIYLEKTSENDNQARLEEEQLKIERQNLAINKSQNLKSTLALLMSAASLVVAILALILSVFQK